MPPFTPDTTPVKAKRSQSHQKVAANPSISDKSVPRDYYSILEVNPEVRNRGGRREWRGREQGMDIPLFPLCITNDAHINPPSFSTTHTVFDQ
jgi:hypothetical protein